MSTPEHGAGASELPSEPAPDLERPAAGPVRTGLARWVFALAAVVLVADQLTKWWALSTLSDGERVPLVGDLLGLRLVFNPGAAFSIATGMTWVLTIIVVAVVVVILRAVRRIGSRGWTVALGLLLGGALGNLGDRLFRDPGFAQGHVVDMIDYGVFVGNVADIAIVAAAILVALLGLRGFGLDGRREHEQQERATPDAEEA
ncbi:signal peptidase II [Isoptericola variabilis]|uniref:Lipoprotein signal peptidase n=1 Tax=Isoptericola variabilis (strain 225) TaxID=743718 RepID=F6FSK1_ISOV2|nr:signal peptidase II [Isoptericola variabilis]AEG44068.1 Lipoprotein signal peptidase [Isoptericola variabilis 225]TWH31744.1 signal peptidase II [Isoptericola variabilis J7]